VASGVRLSSNRGRDGGGCSPRFYRRAHWKRRPGQEQNQQPYDRDQDEHKRHETAHHGPIAKSVVLYHMASRQAMAGAQLVLSGVDALQQAGVVVHRAAALAEQQGHHLHASDVAGALLPPLSPLLCCLSIASCLSDGRRPWREL
jgi:hypothetical protein